MFWIRPKGIQYCDTSRGVAFSAHLLTVDGDVHVGVVENRGAGGDTFIDTMPHFQEQLQTIADACNISMETLLESYMDIAEDIASGIAAHTVDVELLTKIANYKPE